MSYVCEKHGKIRGRGVVGYCPVCGNKTKVINLWPLFRLYVDSDVFRYLNKRLLILFAVTAVTFGGIKIYKWRVEGSEKEREIINSMSVEWQSVYKSIDSMGSLADESKMQALKSFTDNKEFSKDKKLSPKQLEVILDEFGNIGPKTQAIEILNKYIENQK